MKLNIDRTVRVLQRCLIVLFCCWGLVWFSVRAERKSEFERNILEKSVVYTATIPWVVKNWVQLTLAGREHQERLLTPSTDLVPIGELQDVEELNDHYYLLHYRYLGQHAGRVYLQNIKTGEVAREWEVPLSQIHRDLQALKKRLNTDFAGGQIPVNLAQKVTNSIDAIEVNAPLLGEDFSIYFNCESLGFVYKLDEQSRIAWKSEELSHHSLEADEDGNLWTCSVDLTHPLAREHGFREDAALCLSPSGKKLHLHSLSTVFREGGLLKTVFASTPSYEWNYGSDPYHLNDVLPVKSDGTRWNKGDLFLSLRHKSTVLQYRPADRSVVWHQQGPWLAQHDINLIDEQTISVFNNNTFLLSEKVEGAGSNIAVHSLVDGSTKFLGDGLFVSASEGRQTQTDDGWILVEETNRGVYHFLDAAGNRKCQFFIPYHSNPSNAMNTAWGRLYRKSGSEFILQE
ncbi:MAG: arylsulfotransferase family protein [Planctomycetota bacterium]